jgi:hypothetical protein
MNTLQIVLIALVAYVAVIALLTFAISRTFKTQRNRHPQTGRVVYTKFQPPVSTELRNN